MAAPKGNKNAVGHDATGSGRKSAYAERQDAEWMEFVWKQNQDVQELERKVGTKKYAGRDAAALRLLKGDKFIIGKFMDKMLPDLHDHRGKDGETLFPAQLVEQDQFDRLFKRHGKDNS